MLEQFKAKIDRNSARLNKLGKWGEFFVKSLPVLFGILIILLIIIVISFFIPKEYQSKISFYINIVMYLSMFYIMFFAFFISKREKEQYKKLEYKMFNMVISEKLKYKKNFLNISLIPILYFVVPVVTYFGVVYIINLNNEYNINYNNVISNIVTVFSGITSFIQSFKEQNYLPKEEIERNNFENNFRISLEEMNKNKSKEKIKSFLLLIRLIYKELYEYQKNSHLDNRKFIVDNYNYIIKANLDNDILYSIFINQEMQKATENDFTLLSNVKSIFAKYGAFENLELTDEQKEQVFCYPLLSYLGNLNIIVYIFQQAQKNKDIKKYIEQSLNDYIDYAENEEDPIFYLSLIMYDKKEVFTQILNRKLNNVEFSNIHSRNLFILQCIAYSVCNTKLYKKYKNTTKNILSKTTQFLDSQIDDESNETNAVELLNTFNHCIYECMEKNKDENKSRDLIDILLNILKETEYHISITLLLSRIIVFKNKQDWNNLRTVVEEMFKILHPADEIEETRNEQIKRLQTNEIDIKIIEKDLQRYRKNKQRLANFIADNKDKLHIPIMKK